MSADLHLHVFDGIDTQTLERPQRQARFLRDVVTMGNPIFDEDLDDEDLDEDDDCMCNFKGTCAGTGFLECWPPCGGDQCICLCGGERECPGCDLCATDVDLFVDPDNDDQEDTDDA